MVNMPQKWLWWHIHEFAPPPQIGQIWSIGLPWHCIALSPSALLQVSFLPLARLSGKLIQ
jgi:hypothetical protein